MDGPDLKYAEKVYHILIMSCRKAIFGSSDRYVPILLKTPKFSSLEIQLPMVIEFFNSICRKPKLAQDF
jgi:hypothetical protein